MNGPWWLLLITVLAALFIGFVVGNERRIYRRYRSGGVARRTIEGHPSTGDRDVVVLDWSPRPLRQRGTTHVPFKPGGLIEGRRRLGTGDPRDAA